MKYNVDYFINKFEAIPDIYWTSFKYVNGNAYCAMGHCGFRHFTVTPEGKALDALFDKYGIHVLAVNDGAHGYFNMNEAREIQNWYWAQAGETPKERVLNVLYTIKAGVLE